MESPQLFVQSVKTLLTFGDYHLVAQIFKHRFAHADLLIFSIRDICDWTVLHHAAYDNYLEVVKTILDIADDRTWQLLTAETNEGSTALHLATLNGSGKEIVRLLLNAAGKGDLWSLLIKQDRWDRTALYRAAIFGRIEVVELLLNAAGDKVQKLIDICAVDGKRAFDVAKPRTREAIRNHLRTKNIKI